MTIADPWVAVHLRCLLPMLRQQQRRRGGEEEELRRRLNVGPGVRLIGVLNGDDDLLEKLWELDRGSAFARMFAMGIEVITGPTFSVYGEKADLPASHNITMLGRHHRYCAEAAESGLTVVPNLYWRNTTDQMAWAEWVAAHPEVVWLARDFSRTKQQACFQPELAGLLSILERAGRCVNILLTGIGEKKMGLTRQRLEAVGSSCAFVTSRPIVAPPEGPSDEERTATIRKRICEFKERASSAGSLAAFGSF